MLIRAGFVRRLTQDNWLTLSLGMHLQNRVRDLLQNQLSQIGATEISLSLLHMAPEASVGFVDGSTERVQKLEDSGKQYFLGPHQLQAILHLIQSEVHSYRQLPLIIFQSRQAPFFATFAGKGLYDPIVPQILEAWVIASSKEQLGERLSSLDHLIKSSFQSLDIPIESVHSDPGVIGARQAISYLYPTEQGGWPYLQLGEELLAYGMAPFTPSPQASTPLPLEKVHTPGTKTIKDLAALLQIDASQTAKAVFYTSTSTLHASSKLVMVVIRGDLDVNEMAVRRALESSHLRASTDEEIQLSGAVPGYASPIGLNRELITILADKSVVQQSNLVAGANELDYHLLNCCYGREYEADMVGNFCLFPTHTTNSMLGTELSKCIEIGSEWPGRQDITFMGQHGKPTPIHLGYAYWNLSNIMATIADIHHDEHGLRLPADISPFAVMLVSLVDGEETIRIADQLYHELLDIGISVLYDDRHKKVAGPGIKFTDADLRGIPIRITVAKRALKQGGVEWKLRTSSEKRLVAIDQVLPQLLQVFPLD